MDNLETMMAARRADVERVRGKVSLDQLREAAKGRVHHSLSEALRYASDSAIIAEVKKASPSAGVLRPDYKPVELARLYERAGACAVSVLTEPHYFLGGEQDLRAVREAVTLPLLRKDFISDVYQIHESAAWGADVVLLIVGALEEGLLRELYDEALGCGLEVLAEAHSEAELEAALGLDKAIVGVNSRNLRTLRTDLSLPRVLAEHVPPQRRSIVESGIKMRGDIQELETLGYDGFLIGETLLRVKDPERKLGELLGRKEG